MKRALFMALFLVGCSHVQETKTVGLPFAPELVEEMQQMAERSPASLEVEEVEGKSPRRVYFSALYHQYLTLGQHLSYETELNSCPQFHHDKVETDASYVPKVSRYRSSQIDSKGKKFFPELAFTKEPSLGDHFENIRSEINVLCEEGVSDNYYKFDNLVTHYAHKRSFHARPDAMKAILKIPVFANYYLLHMLQSNEALSFVHPEEKQVIAMTQTHWFEKYVAEAQRLRHGFIKNKMVQR